MPGRAVGRAAAIVASMPEVRLAVLDGARRYMGFVKAEAATHGNLITHVGMEPSGAKDAVVFYVKYDALGRGVAGPLEMGHYNVPRGGRWTRGIHILRDAARKAEI